MDDNSLTEHCRDAAELENGFLLFPGEWNHFQLEGSAPQRKLVANRLNDSFVPFCSQHVGGLNDKSVLELGPFEGFHTHAICQDGVREVISIEANPRNFLKCLIVQNFYRLAAAQFRLGDFSKYLEAQERRFDFVLAAGVLYHLYDPIVVLDRIMNVTDSIGICTSYYDPDRKVFKFTGNTRSSKLPGADPVMLHERFNPEGTRGTKHGLDRAAWMFSLPDLLRFLDQRNFAVHQRPAPTANPKIGPRVQLFAQRRGAPDSGSGN